MRFDGVATMVTGGSSGIGRQLALDLARQGAHVAIVSHDADGLRAASAELGQVATKSLAVVCDVGSDEDVKRMGETVLDAFGRLDLLVNNAGYAEYRTFADTPLADVRRLVDVNLVGAMRCISAFLPRMIERRSGAIVNMASIAGRVPLTPNSVYCASKHGLVALSQTLRYELEPFNIRVHVICPGRAETSFFEHETFKSRRARAETKYTVSVEQISRATLDAIARGRFMTYVPWTLGAMAWAMNAWPWMVRPMFDRLMRARIRSYYDDQRAPDDPA
jgi:uncharacterized protein